MEQKLRALIIEDKQEWVRTVEDALTLSDPSLRESMYGRGLYIPDKPFDVDVAQSKTSAMGLITAAARAGRPYDLITLDLLLPEKDDGSVDPVKGRLLGYEVFEEIRRLFSGGVPVVVISNVVSGPDTVWEEHRGILPFLEYLRERRLPPPDELLLKRKYPTALHLMPKLLRYAVDLTEADVRLLSGAGIVVPDHGVTRRVLRELKRMACSAALGSPRSDVLLLGENGVGKSTFARAYHLLRPRFEGSPRLGFEHLDLGSLDVAGSAPNIALFGATDFNGAWSLGAFVRATLYRRGGVPRVFSGQEVELGQRPSDGPENDRRDRATAGAGASDKSHGRVEHLDYPDAGDTVDFDGSGTLFLDEVINISPTTQAMLLQALNYDLRARRVYTTGHSPRCLMVGPSLVFATANFPQATQWQRERTKERMSGEHFPTMSDYLFRIDQMRVTVPPLREREPDEILSLLRKLVHKRTPSRDPAALDIEALPTTILTETLHYYNNVADLQRIADQVLPEENTITWQHVAPIFERERPVVAVSSSAGKGTQRNTDYARAREKYNELRHSGKTMPLSRLQRDLDVSPNDAYHIGLLFMADCGCQNPPRWPSDKDVQSLFGHGARAFRTYLHRLSKYRQGSFCLADALRDLRQLQSIADAGSSSKQ